MTDWIRIDGDRFVRNGRPVRLKGTNFQTPDSPWRVLDVFNVDSIEAGLDDAAALGCNCARLYVGVENPKEQERFADFLDRAATRGIRLYPCFAWHDTFGMPPGDWMAARRGVDTVRRFAERWKDDPRILAWDLINEPDWFDDDRWQWAMAPEAATMCVDWLLAVLKAVRDVDPNHPVSVGLIFNYSWWTPPGAARLADAVDFVDFHYYHRTYQDRSLGEAIREMKEHTRKPILVGEFGNSSNPDFSTDGEPEHSEAIQAEIYRGYARDLAAEGIAGCIQWTISDYADRPREDGENEYGILRADRTWKPAAFVYRDEIPSDPLG